MAKTREIELRMTVCALTGAETVEWRYAGDSAWRDLDELSAGAR